MGLKYVAVNMFLLLSFFLKAEIEDFEKLQKMRKELDTLMLTLSEKTAELHKLKGGKLAGSPIQSEEEFWEKVASLKSEISSIRSKISTIKQKCDSLEKDIKRRVKEKLNFLNTLAQKHNFLVVHSPLTFPDENLYSFLKLCGINPEEFVAKDREINTLLLKIMLTKSENTH